MFEQVDRTSNEQLLGRVLVVDDELEIRSMLARHLLSTGYKTIVAEDGQQALELLTHHPVDVVIADITMPRMSGLVLLQRIREHFPGCRVLVMTGRLSEDTLIEAMRHGADGCLLKPLVDMNLLDQAVERAIRARAAWQNCLTEVRGRAQRLQVEPFRERPKLRSA